MAIHQVKDAASWKRLLAYYTDCLREESRLRYVIEPEDIQETCWFLPTVDGNFLRNVSFFSISIRRNRKAEIERLQRFALGEPRSGKCPSVCFGYPFFVDSHRNLMPLFYVDVSGHPIDDGVWLTSQSPEVEINFVTLRKVLRGDEKINLDKVLGRFDELEAGSGKTHFDQALDLLLSYLEMLSGEPVARVSRKHFESQQLPRHAVVECPLLFYVRAGDTSQLLRELGQLKEEHNWNKVQPALRHLLTKSNGEPYPGVPELDKLAVDSRLYVVPASDSQRKAIAAAGQCPLTVVTGPPGMDRSQLILNIVGDAVLRGETILVASSNDKTVDVVFEHFSITANYPGIVRSGKTESRGQMLTAMRRALAAVREEGIAGRLEQVRGEYKEMLTQVDGQRDAITLIEQLERDRETHQVKMQELLETLPKPVRTSVKRGRIRFGKDNGQQLSAAIHALLKDVQEVVVQRQDLAEDVQALLWDNREGIAFLRELEEAEQRLGISVSLRRPSVDLGSFPAIEAHISAWESLPKVLPLEDRVRQLNAEIVDAEHRAQSQREGLPADLSATLNNARLCKTFDEQREQSLRRGLKDIENEVNEAISDYRRLVKTVDDLLKRSEFVQHWLLGATELQVGDVATLRVEDILDRGFAIEDDVFNAHRLGIVQADLVAQLALLRQGRDSKMAEFQGLLVRLGKESIVARSQVPALLRARIETALEVSDHKAWHNLAVQLAKIDIRVARIETGGLTLREQLRGIAFRGWAVKELRGELRALSDSNADLFALNPVEEPPDAAPFEHWADYVHTWNSFAQACALAAQRAHVQQTLVSYYAQSESETNAKSAELQEVETEFTDLVARLPETIAEAMRGNTWLFEPIDETVVRDLDVLRGQYQNLKAQYADWAERLMAFQRNRTLPKALQRAIQALSPNRKRRTGSDASRATPLVVRDLISAWLDFSQAAEAEYELWRLRQRLTEVEAELNVLWEKLPDGMRQELDWSTVPYSENLLKPFRQYLSSLRTEMALQVEEWNGVQERAIALLHHNALESHALDQVFKKAQKNPNYLSGLLDKAYEHPEQLLDDLQVWQQVIQVWHVQAQLAQVRARLRKYSSRDEAQPALGRSSEQGQDLAGQVLTEQWRHVVAELAPATVHSIDQYLSAIEALVEGEADSADLRQGAEAHYSDVLKLFPIWLVTNLSTQDIPLRAGLFDCVVMDEASQRDIPSALPLAFRGKRIVVIGDRIGDEIGGERQSSHIVTLSDAVNRQFSERHNVGTGTNYDYRLYSLFDLAANSVAESPGQVFLDEETL